MGSHLNLLDEPVLMEVPKPMQNEFGIHHRLESCALVQQGIILSVQWENQLSCTVSMHVRWIYRKWQHNLKTVQSHDVAPSLYCTAISIDSPHIRKDGANHLNFLLDTALSSLSLFSAV